ncbi:hypothetical protein JL720_5459 [Aureococcus anophagefferens]|nr:hypothetical protein JL720_5459 [Aureococcus anophagefferens]
MLPSLRRSRSAMRLWACLVTCTGAQTLAPTTPETTDLELWLSAQDLQPGPVASWPDRSSHGRLLEQDDAAAQPVALIDGSGRARVAFDEAWLSLGCDYIHAEGDGLTILAAVRDVVDGSDFGPGGGGAVTASGDLIDFGATNDGYGLVVETDSVTGHVEATEAIAGGLSLDGSTTVVTVEINFADETLRVFLNHTLADTEDSGVSSLAVLVAMNVGMLLACGVYVFFDGLGLRDEDSPVGIVVARARSRLRTLSSPRKLKDAPPPEAARAATELTTNPMASARALKVADASEVLARTPPDPDAPDRTGAV